jgi:hypothetical protein
MRRLPHLAGIGESAVIEVLTQRVNQLGVLAVVILEEGTEPFADEIFDRSRYVCGVDQSMETKLVVGRRPRGWGVQSTEPVSY